MSLAAGRLRTALVATAVSLVVAVAAFSLVSAGPRGAAVSVVTSALGLWAVAGGMVLRRFRAIATGLALVGGASALGTLQLAPDTRALGLAACGAALFAAAELLSRALEITAGLQRGRGVDRGHLALVLGVAVGAGALTLATTAARGLLAGGGAPALAAGTASAVAAAVLVAAVLRARARAA